MNEAPIVSEDIVESIDENDGLVIDLLQNASDPDAGDSLSLSNLVVTSPDVDLGGVSIDGSVVTVDPDHYDYLADGESLVISGTYDVVDAAGLATSTSVSITINGSNDAPVISSAIDIVINENINEGNSDEDDDEDVVVDLLQNASDPDASDSLSVSNLVVTTPDVDLGGVSVEGAEVTVDPDHYDYLAEGENIVISGTYDVIDGNGGVTPTNINLTIEGANDAPVISEPIQIFIDQNDPVTAVDLLQNATDAEGDALSLANLVNLSGDVDYSGVSVSGSIVTIDPSQYSDLAAGESVVLQGTYDVVDANGAVTPTEAQIIITGPNAAPVVNTDESTDFVGELSESDETVFSSDLDSLAFQGTKEGAAIQTVQTLVAGDVVSFDWNFIDVEGGNIFFDDVSFVSVNGELFTLERASDPDTGFQTFTFTVPEDGEYTFGIGVANARDNFFDSSLLVDNFAINGTLLAGFETSDDESVFTSVGTTSLINSFENNDEDAIPTEGSVMLQLVAAGATPEAMAEFLGLNTNTTLQVRDSFEFTDFDGNDSHSIIAIVADAGNTLGGTVEAVTSSFEEGLTTQGTIVWNYSVDIDAVQFLAEGEQLTETFTITIADDQGGTVDQDVVVTITGTNDAPVVSSAIDIVIDENDGLVLDLLQNASDVDASDELSLANLVVTSPDVDFGGVSVSGGIVTVDASHYTYLAAGESIVLSGTYDVVDGNGGVTPTSATITIEGTDNNVPIVSAPLIETIQENDGLVIDLLQNASDPDVGDSVSVSNLALTSPGVDLGGVSIDGSVVTVDNAHYDYLAVGESLVISATYDVVDDSGDVTPTSISITISGDNDRPEITFSSADDDEDNDSSSLVKDAINGVDGVSTLGDVFTINEFPDNTGSNEEISLLNEGFLLPTQGSSMALLNSQGASDSDIESFLGLSASLDDLTGLDATNGSAMSGSLSLEAGDVLTFDWDFIDNEGSTEQFIDFSFVSINGVATILEQVNDPDTGFQTFSFTAPTTGTYALGVGVLNVSDTAVNAQLLVDNLQVNGVLVNPFDTTSTVLSESGSIAFNDVDLNDELEVSFEASESNTLDGTFTLSPVTEDASLNGGTMQWTFEIDNADVQFLEVGESRTEEFTITVSDGNGGVDSTTIFITVSGSFEGGTADVVSLNSQDADTSEVDLSSDEAIDLNVLSSQESIDLESFAALSEEISAIVPDSVVTLLSDVSSDGSANEGYKASEGVPDISNIDIPGNVDVWTQAELASDLLFLNDIALQADSLA